MGETVRRIEYYYTVIPNKAGAGARVLGAFKAEGVNLVAHTGFPTSWGRAQLDFVPSDPDKLLAAARKTGIKLVGPKVAFIVQGEDRPGAVADVLGKLAQAQVSVTAMQAVSSGEGRYGAILWVQPGDIGKVAQTLGVS